MAITAKRVTIRHELRSEYFDERPDGTVIDTVVIHSMFNSACTDDKYSASSCKEIMDTYQVSAHYIIDRQGKVWQLVPEEKRAWHAGISQLADRAIDSATVNPFTIGIELVALVATNSNHFTKEQYSGLAHLTSQIMSRHPIKNICGHRHVAAGRKSDPWGFDWGRFRNELEVTVGEVGEIKFPDCQV